MQRISKLFYAAFIPSTRHLYERLKYRLVRGTKLLLYNHVIENEWSHIVTTYDSINKQICVYVNGELWQTNTANGGIDSGDDNLRIGIRISETYPEYFHGTIDDVKLYAKALNENEIMDLYTEQVCTSVYTVSIFDTTTIYQTKTQNDTVTLYNTIYNTITVYNSVAVTDTLFLNFNFTNINSNIYYKTIKVYPNPTNDYITIDTKELAGNEGLQFKIINSQFQVLHESEINMPEYKFNLNQFGAKGVYQIIILNSKSELLAIKKSF